MSFRLGIVMCVPLWLIVRSLDPEILSVVPRRPTLLRTDTFFLSDIKAVIAKLVKDNPTIN